MSASTTAAPRAAWVEHHMGMPISVHVRGPGAGTAEVARRVAAVFAGLREVDETFSTYRAGSAISRLNRGEVDLLGAGDLVAEVAALCARARARTDGYFDAGTLHGGGSFDPTGLVKGWGVARAARHFDGLDDHDLCLNAGGDILLRTAADGSPWRVGIEDPDRPGQLLRVITRVSGAVATSGSAHRGAHITNPHTGLPAEQVRAVTVIGPSLTWADVYATAAAARGVDAVAWLETVPSYEALVVDRDRLVHATSGWPAS